MSIEEILKNTAHRPWPLPKSPWVLKMQWLDLAFLHWPVSPEALKPLLPRSLTVDTYNGEAWIGVTPFRMAGVRPRLLPPVPGASTFEELNVRTYVRFENLPGIWFFSLDAASRLAVVAARLLCGLPYFSAEMRLRRDGAFFEYRSRRIQAGGLSAEFRGRYRPTGPVMVQEPENLGHWLTERYCLFAAARGRLYRLDVHHCPWPLQPATVEVDLNTLVAAGGVEVADAPPLVHYSSRLDVLAWWPVAID